MIKALQKFEKDNISVIAQNQEKYISFGVVFKPTTGRSMKMTCCWCKFANAGDTYGLDPAHGFTMAGYSWCAFLKMTGVEVDLLHDVDMYQAFEQAKRGGVCCVSNKLVESNVPKFWNSKKERFEDNLEYDNKKPTKHVRYDDANNLYGWAMVQKLPVSDFKWAKPEKYVQVNE